MLMRARAGASRRRKARIGAIEMSGVNWARMSREDFDSAVESLLVSEFTGNGCVAQALDGRGGDGGIDVDVRAKKTNQVIHVYQLKYFPEGFSGGFRDRRSQIKKSLLAAASETSTPVWTLVVPRNVTSHERKAVRGMRKGLKMEVRFMGPAELDGLLAKHPDIERRLTLDRELEILQAVNRESASLAGPYDLATELGLVATKLAEQSTYWSRGFSVDANGRTTEHLAPKRPDAQEREPISITANLAFGPEDEALRRRFDAAMEYGTLEPLHLPSAIVESVVREGPPWFAREDANAGFSLLPTSDGAENSAVIVRTGLAGDPPVELAGRVTGRAHGALGGTFEIRTKGGLTLTWKVAFPPRVESGVSFATDFSGESARSVMRVVRFLDTLIESGRIGLCVEGRAESWAQGATTGASDYSSTHPEIVACLEDLSFLERELDLDFEFPAGLLSASDAIEARVARLVLEGHAVPNPDTFVFNATLSGADPERLVPLLTEGAALVIMGDVTSEILGKIVHLGEVAFYAPTQ